MHVLVTMPRAHRVLLEVVRTGQLGKRHQRLDAARRRIAGIRPHVAAQIRVDGEQARFGVERRPDEVMLVARVRGGEEVLVPVLDPGERPPQLAREPHQHDVFREQLHLLPEAAAHVRGDHAQIGFRNAQGIGQAGAQHVRHLHRAGQGDASARLVPGGVRGARLHRHRRLAARAHVDLDHFCRTREGGLQSGRAHRGFDDHVGRRFGVHPRRRSLEGGVEIDDGVLRFDLGLDQIGEVFGARCILGDDHREGLADVVHAPGGERGLRDRNVIGAMQQRPDRLHADEVARDENERALGLADRANAPARHGAAHEAHRRRAARKVAGIPSAPEQQRGILEAAQAAADPAHAALNARSRARRVVARTRSLR